MLMTKNSLRRVAVEAPRTALSVLLVEAADHPQKLLRILLADGERFVQVVCDCEVALARLLRDPFDLVLIDNRIEEADWRQFVADFKRLRPGSMEPKFVGIGASVAELLAEEKDHGLDDAFSMPFVYDKISTSHGAHFTDIDKLVVAYDDSQVPDESQPGVTLVRDGNAPERRRYRRLQGNIGGTTMVTADGEKLSCQIFNISCGGAQVIVARRPAVGEVVVIGKTVSKIVRHIEQGVAVEFQ